MISAKLVTCCLFMLFGLSNFANANSLQCCAIEMPSKPIFNAQGNLIGYEPQPCPENFQVCCDGYINILGKCITLALANQMLPMWQALAAEKGITLGEAIIQMGVIVG